MIIYIPLEVPARELSGHLLLAMAAAKSGHQVLIANNSDIWLYKRLGLLKPGAYVFKNIRIPDYSGSKDIRGGVGGSWYHKHFVESGFDLYCHEQEPPILWDNFSRYVADADLHDSQIQPFKAVFCWGQRDKQAFAKFFNDNEAFFDTGSPRSDLWSPRFRPLYEKKAAEHLKPYLLFVSNFMLMGNEHPARLMQAHESIKPQDRYNAERNLLDYMQEDYSVAFSMVAAIRHLARKYPDVTIVVRPHPMESVDNWASLFSSVRNVHVTGNTDSISPWIAHASAIIQSGCTSAVEAVLQGRPLISYGPDRACSGLTIPNKLGLRIRSLNDLEEAIGEILTTGNAIQDQEDVEAILKPLVTIEDESAALKIVRIMESMSSFDARLSKRDRQILGACRFLKDVLDSGKSRLSPKWKSPSDFGFGKRQICERVMFEISTISKITGLEVPSVDFYSRSGIFIE